MEQSKKSIIKNPKASILTKSALFAAIATLLMYFEFPLPFMPPFLKVDLSGVAILLATMILGPWNAVAVCAVKDLIHLLSTKTGGVGELADFIVLSVFAVIVGVFYLKGKNKNSLLIGTILGIISITIIGALLNKYMLIPFYSKVMPIDAIISACSKVNKFIGDINTYVWFGAAPFNFIKGIILTTCTALLYGRLSKVINKI